MLPTCLTFFIGASFNVALIMCVCQFTLMSIAQTLCKLALLFSEDMIVTAAAKIQTGMKSTTHLINADPSNVVIHTKATWLHLENTWFNFLLAQF